MVKLLQQPSETNIPRPSEVFTFVQCPPQTGLCSKAPGWRAHMSHLCDGLVENFFLLNQ